MSESHEKYKEWKMAERDRVKAERRGSCYVEEYRQKERILELEYKLKDREEREDFERAYRFLSDYEY